MIAHVPGITQEWINRFKAIGGGLSLTGWQFLAGGVDQPDAPYAGPPFRMILDSGIHAGMSSDGMQIAPMNPWIHMYFATTGINARGVAHQRRPARSRARRCWGSTPASNGWFLREENELGSIEVGKLADLVVLNQDYFSVPDEQLKRIRSVLTIVGGNIVHDAEVLRVEREDDDDDDGRGATESCAEGAAGVRPLLSAGRRVVVDGHAICAECGGAVEPVGPEQWRHGLSRRPRVTLLSVLLRFRKALSVGVGVRGRSGARRRRCLARVQAESSLARQSGAVGAGKTRISSSSGV